MNSPVSFHGRYLSLVRQIEYRFRVTEWKFGDVELWPLARMGLYLDMFWQDAKSSPPPDRALPLRFASGVARPIINRWRSRMDLDHYVSHPQQAGAVFLGDGVSLDRVEGAWVDRFGEPLIAALEQRGMRTFLMQSGNLNRLPWKRRTFAANRIAAAGWLKTHDYDFSPDLPDHAEVLCAVAKSGFSAPSLHRIALAKQACLLCGAAAEFERLLRIIKPTLAFVVTYYAGLGPAFVLACRRQGILSVDLQHCPQENSHKAYRWFAVPPNGYKLLPAVFWNWTERDCENIQSWAGRLARPWHRGVHGGHVQIDRFLQDVQASRMPLNESLAKPGAGRQFEREILVALQPIPGNREIWNALASQIEISPPTWRWWIRRHPASLPRQDAEFGRLLTSRGPNIVIDGSSLFSLPNLLERMDVILSLASGASSEAAIFGVPALFLSHAAQDYFGEMIARGEARIIDVSDVIAEIVRLPERKDRQPAVTQGDGLNASIARLERIAIEYTALCRSENYPNALQHRLQAGNSPPLRRSARRNPASFS